MTDDERGTILEFTADDVITPENIVAYLRPVARFSQSV
jgi:hypothetical protein